MLHYLYLLKEIFTMTTTKGTIPTSKWQILNKFGHTCGQGRSLLGQGWTNLITLLDKCICYLNKGGQI
jgi:hypothetical protein